jgi:flagellar biosynthesis/type III secretory pathway chaperone
MDPSLVGDHMRDLLGEEAVLLSELEALLGRETEALKADDLPEIEHIGRERHRCVEALMRIDSERRVACRMLGLADEKHQFEKLLDRCDTTGSLKSRWHSGLEIAARCKDMNERNGAVVTAKMRRVEALLMTVRGGQDTVAPVYGASGLRPLAARGLELGCA